jgi:hypothetical protein
MTTVERASETGRRFHVELRELLANYINDADALTQASIGGALLAEAVRGAIEMAIPKTELVASVLEMYAMHKRGIGRQ